METKQVVDAEFKVEHVAGNVDADHAAFLAVRPQEIDNAADFRALTALYLTNLKGTGWGKDLTAHQARTLAVAAQSTNLNPLLGEIVMLGGNAYVTEVGVLRNADRSPQYDGYDLEPLSEEERKAHRIASEEFAYKALVYRKDRSHPTVGIGHASSKNVAMAPIKENWLAEMAQKRAIERALSRAFPPGLPLYDEQAMQPRIVSAEVAPAYQEAMESNGRILELQQQLKWTSARLEVERKAVNGDSDALIARMFAAVKSSGKAQQSEPAPVETAPEPITDAQNAKLFACLGELGMKTKPARIKWAKDNDVDVPSFKDLTKVQAMHLIDEAEKQVALLGQPPS